jgi:hypothetical protein
VRRLLAKLSLVLIVCTLASATVFRFAARAEEENVKTFFDSDILGIKIQVNATASTRPGNNLTVWLHLLPETSQTNVSVQLLKLEIYGFLNGTDEKVSIGSITGYNISLSGVQTAEYDANFTVPDWVFGETFGSIKLTNIQFPVGSVTLMIPDAASGFYMTNVENTYYETQVNALKESIDQLTSSNGNLTALYSEALANIDQLTNNNNNLTALYSEASANITQLDQTVTMLAENLTMLELSYNSTLGSMSALENTREVAVVLGITTVFFVATTVFMIMRRPRERW